MGTVDLGKAAGALSGLRKCAPSAHMRDESHAGREPGGRPQFVGDPKHLPGAPLLYPLHRKHVQGKPQPRVVACLAGESLCFDERAAGFVGTVSVGEDPPGHLCYLADGSDKLWRRIDDPIKLPLFRPPHLDSRISYVRATESTGVAE
ncbi:hypothetical protein [Streptomyces sp. NPDC014734]|uniref:hypothetical protein n=1 Tax=Streptomyces sp. NPDC014734 TaxID=3364886 RepID=UPI0036F99B63